MHQMSLRIFAQVYGYQNMLSSYGSCEISRPCARMMLHGFRYVKTCETASSCTATCLLTFDSFYVSAGLSSSLSWSRSWPGLWRHLDASSEQEDRSRSCCCRRWGGRWGTVSWGWPPTYVTVSASAPTASSSPPSTQTPPTSAWNNAYITNWFSPETGKKAGYTGVNGLVFKTFTNINWNKKWYQLQAIDS